MKPIDAPRSSSLAAITKRKTQLPSNTLGADTLTTEVTITANNTESQNLAGLGKEGNMNTEAVRIIPRNRTLTRKWSKIRFTKASFVINGSTV